MISFFSDKVYQLVISILDLLPSVDIPVFTVGDVINDLVSVLQFLLPMDTIGNIFAISITITLLRFTFALILRIKSFIPTLGS